MKILKHMTANEEKLKPFPFRRELSMESYLVENESILSLDSELFCDVTIIEEELTLKQGRSSRDTDGRIDLLISYSQEYIGVVELKLGELNEIHLMQIEDYLKEREQILKQYPDIIDSDSSKNPKWIGILVGDSIHPSLASKISDGYVTNDGIQIAALTIQRFRSETGNIYVITDSFFKNSLSNKDYSQYEFDGDVYGKGRLVLAVMKKHVELNPNITFSELEQIFPKTCQGSSGVFKTYEDANEIISNSGRRRHFIQPDETIELSDCKIAVSSQWGVRNINKFISKAKKLGYVIKNNQ